MANRIPSMLNFLNIFIMVPAVLYFIVGVVCPAVGLCFLENTVFHLQLVIILHSFPFGCTTFDPGGQCTRNVSTAILGLRRVCFGQIPTLSTSSPLRVVDDW